MNNNDVSLSISNESQSEQLDLPLFNFAAISTASDKFSFSNKIGQGGFGTVYKVFTISTLYYTLACIFFNKVHMITIDRVFYQLEKKLLSNGSQRILGKVFKSS